eukprot:CAMPEP_0114980950 /NCGR_PEP_ID=MMETSP0216-20121206/5263_1 /TAXON_ID=223996 /ORGANISM="Protocruzia adherens, Strain Boccale" /LENGTH=405 /DNA_ID=CAMNT_0002342547 /DNA_START=41 /DNA_END=1258 /DNA_ORIENTATION=+
MSVNSASPKIQTDWKPMGMSGTVDPLEFHNENQNNSHTHNVSFTKSDLDDPKQSNHVLQGKSVLSEEGISTAADRLDLFEEEDDDDEPGTTTKEDLAEGSSGGADAPRNSDGLVRRISESASLEQGDATTAENGDSRFRSNSDLQTGGVNHRVKLEPLCKEEGQDDAFKSMTFEADITGRITKEEPNDGQNEPSQGLATEMVITGESEENNVIDENLDSKLLEEAHKEINLRTERAIRNDHKKKLQHKHREQREAENELYCTKKLDPEKVKATTNLFNDHDFLEFFDTLDFSSAPSSSAVKKEEEKYKGLRSLSEIVSDEYEPPSCDFSAIGDQIWRSAFHLLPVAGSTAEKRRKKGKKKRRDRADGPGDNSDSDASDSSKRMRFSGMNNVHSRPHHITQGQGMI